MSLVETMSDKSGVIASGMLEISAICNEQMSIILCENSKTLRSDTERKLGILKIRFGYQSLQVAVWVRLHTSPAQLLRFDSSLFH